MRVLQADPQSPEFEEVLAQARQSGAAVALPLGVPAAEWARVREAGLQAVGWWRAAFDPEACEEHPEWMHAPQHGEWLRRFPEFTAGHPALVWPYIGLGTREPFEHALDRLTRAAQAAPIETLYLADLQGPPMGCGCGNPSCRSWDNAPGKKVAPSAYALPEVLFPLRFFQEARRRLPHLRIIPILCPECERGIALDGVEDPDGPSGTDLCQGVACMSPCARDYWPRLLQAFRAEQVPMGLLLTVSDLEKDHPVYGEPRAWAERAWRHYGTDLIPVVEREDQGRFETAVVVNDYRHAARPVAPPAGYVPSVPPIACGCAES